MYPDIIKKEKREKKMKTDIILSGVGGQGILSIAAVIGGAAVRDGLYMKQSEVHGMSQRGGDVQSNLRLADKPIASDLIPLGQADLIISLEPMESLRYLPWLKKDGWLVTNIRPFVNIPDYPEMEKIHAELEKLPHTVALDVETIAKETVGSPRTANIVMLGASTPFVGIGYDRIADGIRSVFGRKGTEVVEMNLKALQAGYDAAREYSGFKI
jgi:indolepyruvate ferredoxin oxidoreductase beta subunit